MGEICELENVLGASVPGVLFPVGKNSSLSFVLSRSVVSDSCEPVDCSPSGSSVHGTIQARILERVAFPFSRGSSKPRDRTQVSCIAGGLFTN